MSIKKFEFQPQDITIRDDAWHKKENFFHIETWYFDGNFSNNYSVVTLVNIFTIGNSGFVLTGFFIYKDTELIISKRERHPFKNLYGSDKKPILKINDRHILSSIYNENTKNWIYNISVGNNETGFDLNLIKAMKPWKGKTQLGRWLVIPLFDINGVIHLKGKDINVVGKGYHDHNIYPFIAPAFSKGYQFGKIPIDSVNITWARVMKRIKGEEIIVVLNNEDNYITINPKDIRFRIEKQVKDHGKLIPEIISLKIENDLLNLKVNMKKLNIHHIHMPAINYWRYHFLYEGNIKLNSISKKINQVEIAEFLKFL
jgi:hypothetical protein